MKKKIHSEIKKNGQRIYKDYSIDINNKFTEINFRKKSKLFHNLKIEKKIMIEKEGLFDYDHPRAEKGEKKLVTKYNSKWVYALNKAGRKCKIRVGVRAKKTFEDDCRICKVKKMLFLKSFKYANFIFNLKFIAQNLVIFYEITIVITKKDKKFVSKRKDEVTSSMLCEITGCNIPPKRKRLTGDVKKERDEKLIYDSTIRQIPRERIQEIYKLTKSQTNRILQNKRIPKKTGE